MSEKPERPNLDAIEARWDSPPRPWEGALVTIGARAATLYDNARADVPTLLAYARALETERDALKVREAEAAELLREVVALEGEMYWDYSKGEHLPFSCRACGKRWLEDFQEDHHDDCPVIRARAWLDGV